jgi:hypothetical protein
MKRGVLYHYCVVRDDLPRGVLAAQLIHAAGESGGGGQPGMHAVALAVGGEAELRLVEDRLRFLEIAHRAIREPDPPWNGQLMARDARRIRQVLKRLPLLK